MSERELRLKKQGEKLRTRRLQRGLSQDELAKQLGTSRVSVNYWENGKAEPLPIFREKINRSFGKIYD